MSVPANSLVISRLRLSRLRLDSQLGCVADCELCSRANHSALSSYQAPRTSTRSSNSTSMRVCSVSINLCLAGVALTLTCACADLESLSVDGPLPADGKFAVFPCLTHLRATRAFGRYRDSPPIFPALTHLTLPDFDALGSLTSLASFPVLERLTILDARKYSPAWAVSGVAKLPGPLRDAPATLTEFVAGTTVPTQVLNQLPLSIRRLTIVPEAGEDFPSVGQRWFKSQREGEDSNLSEIVLRGVARDEFLRNFLLASYFIEEAELHGCTVGCR